MNPKCSDCFYCRRGPIATYQPAYTCLHPVSRNNGVVARLADQCSDMRGTEGACGPAADLFLPVGADAPQPLHMFRN